MACTKPKNHRLAAELWTLSELAKYTRRHTPSAENLSLSKAEKATIWRKLSANEIRPQKKYYLERRDPDFDLKMQEILMVYQKVNLQNDQPSTDTSPQGGLLYRLMRNLASRQSKILQPTCRQNQCSTQA